MNNMEDIMRAVEQLSADEMAAFRDWFEELESRRWDEQIEHDVKAGRLDWLIEETKRDATKLPLPTKQ
jgi:hypothetical protein